MDIGGIFMSEEISNIKKLELDVEEYAYRYLSKYEISVITSVKLEWMSMDNHPIGRAFLRGRFKRKAEFHDSIIQLSKQLSSPAMQIEQKIAEQTFINDWKTKCD
jgi:hypothetical protein